jgi:hypothetical protein
MLLEEPGVRESLPPKDGKKAALSGEVFGALINLSGRRRFTSQRIVLYALLGASGREGAVDTARAALNLFRDAHTALVHGNEELPGVFSESLRAAYFGDLQGDQKIRNFIESAERTIEAIEAKSPRVSVLLDELVDSATPLLAVANQLTQIYEEESKRHAIAVKRQLLGVMTDIQTISQHAHIVAFNAKIVAARSGSPGREFSVVAIELIAITRRIDELVKAVMRDSIA